jgi:predicted nucleic acid-binding protein
VVVVVDDLSASFEWNLPKEARVRFIRGSVLDEERLKRFVDTNVFVYALTGHPRFGEVAKTILERIEAGEAAVTSPLVLCKVAWVLETMGKQREIKPTLEKILSYGSLEVVGFDEDDLLVGANNMVVYQIDFNDGVNVVIMERNGIREVYSNDKRYLGKVDFLRIVFE